MAVRQVPAPRPAVHGGALQWPRPVSISASQGASLQDGPYWCDATAATVDISLPAAGECPPGTQVAATLVAGGNTVRFLPNGADTISGANAAYSFSVKQISSCILETDGATAWWPIATAVA